MVIDTSAIVAILRNEAERHDFDRLVRADEIRLISAVTRVEATCVVEGRWGELGRAGLDRFLRLTNAEIVVVDSDQVEVALATFRRYGKGRHRASLNIGDCFAYALAKSTGERLLFKGDDFSHTDIEPAYRP
ncbi:MAG TPA: type II toxin-antitoxin system VapC family toxin [Stellaceae bacterium]|jgi:ribonuclease VapC|nr:type II toxin-antitoxin system VapC family toxin [Stellaceae bacterium]